jgi:hypothetical protein
MIKAGSIFRRRNSIIPKMGNYPEHEGERYKQGGNFLKSTSDEVDTHRELTISLEAKYLNEK